MRPAGRAARLVATVLATTVVLALACAGAALAATPVLSIVHPLAGAATGEQPVFQGSSTDTTDSVTLEIYEGPSAGGTPVQTLTVPVPTEIGPEDAIWGVAPGSPLVPGQYTAVAEQTNVFSETGGSPPVTFTVDTPPEVSIDPIASPTKNPTPTLSGHASEGLGDDSIISVTIYYGESAGGRVAATGFASRTATGWEYTPTTLLGEGSYTAVATEGDEAGEFGTSAAVTFVVLRTGSFLTLETSAFEQAGRHGLVSGPTPSFQGSASEDHNTVTVRIYAGDVASGSPDREMRVARNGTRWAAGPVQALVGGPYTVQAEQGDASEEFQFTVDATPPHVTLTSPPSGSSSDSASQTLAGGAGGEEGDSASVAIHLYGGSAASGVPLQTISTEAVGGSWTASVGGLEPGTYTALAEQEDDVGNIGYSEAATFTVVAAPVVVPPVPASPSAPVASFTWFPSAPHTGEPISLVSTSTDASSAISSFGWALAGNGVFSAGGSTIDTSFSTPGSHLVQLRVIDANGQMSVVSEAIPVSAPVIPLMQPFPVVRVAGSFSSSGAKIGVLTVLAPVGATVRVTCKGGGCPAKGQSVRALAGAKSKASTVLITFHRFQRSLRTGAVLDVWVSEAGEIGKFTRFVIRRDRPPTRTDLCLNPLGTAPLTCPAS